MQLLIQYQPRDVQIITHFLHCHQNIWSGSMAFRTPITQLTKRASQSTISKLTRKPTTPLWQRGGADQLRSFATPVPPVTQDATSSKGPTAMVFMNMGGPSTTDEVGDFLSRLFVRTAPAALGLSLISIKGRCGLNTSRTIPELSWPSYCQAPNA